MERALQQNGTKWRRMKMIWTKARFQNHRVHSEVLVCFNFVMGELFISCFTVRPTSDKIYVMWSPPLSQNIKIRNYIIGWGKGVPDNASEALDEKQRSFVIHSVGKL